MLVNLYDYKSKRHITTPPVCPDEKKRNSGVGWGFCTKKKHTHTRTNIVGGTAVLGTFFCFYYSLGFIDPFLSTQVFEVGVGAASGSLFCFRNFRLAYRRSLLSGPIISATQGPSRSRPKLDGEEGGNSPAAHCYYHHSSTKTQQFTNVLDALLRLLCSSDVPIMITLH